MLNELDIVSDEALAPETRMAPGAPGLAAIALDGRDVPGSRHAMRPGRWYDAFRLDDERIVVSIGDLGSNDPSALVRRLRETLGAYAEPRESRTMLALAGAVLRDDVPAHAASALVGIVDCKAHQFSYVGAAPAPHLRYADGTVAVLPADRTFEESQTVRPFAETAVDLRGVALLLLFTDGLVRAGEPGDAGPPLLQSVLADDRLADCASPSGWLARRMLDGRSHDGAAILALTFAAAPVPVVSQTPPGWSVAWSFEASAASSNAVRRAFLAALSAKSSATRTVDLGAAELIFGEMIGNVVRHAPGRVDIVLDWTAELPVLHVKDNGPGFRSRRRRERLPVDEFSESGRGLFIINACAVDFSVRNRAGRGTHATATLALAT